MATTYVAECSCKWQVNGLTSEAEAARLAAFHEARNLRRAYAHDAGARETFEAAINSAARNARLAFSC